MYACRDYRKAESSLESTHNMKRDPHHEDDHRECEWLIRYHLDQEGVSHRSPCLHLNPNTSTNQISASYLSGASYQDLMNIYPRSRAHTHKQDINVEKVFLDQLISRSAWHDYSWQEQESRISQPQNQHHLHRDLHDNQPYLRHTLLLHQ